MRREDERLKDILAARSRYRFSDCSTSIFLTGDRIIQDV